MTDAMARARALIGVRFRPQGRHAVDGLDCVGLVIQAYGLPTGFGRRDYRLRGGSSRELFAVLRDGPFRRVTRTQLRTGDLMVMQVGPDQLHLGIRSDAGMIHADAGLRKMVERPGQIPWPLLAVFRRRVRA